MGQRSPRLFVSRQNAWLVLKIFTIAPAAGETTVLSDPHHAVADRFLLAKASSGTDPAPLPHRQRRDQFSDSHHRHRSVWPPSRCCNAFISRRRDRIPAPPPSSSSPIDSLSRRQQPEWSVCSVSPRRKRRGVCASLTRAESFTASGADGTTHDRFRRPYRQPQQYSWSPVANPSSVLLLVSSVPSSSTLSSRPGKLALNIRITANKVMKVDDKEYNAHHQQHPDVIAGRRQVTHREHNDHRACREREARMGYQQRRDEQAGYRSKWRAGCAPAAAP